MVGWQYRPAIVVFSIGFAWIEFIDVTTYLNHYWFMTTLGLSWSSHRWTRRFALGGHDADRSVAGGSGWSGSRSAVVYVFAGLAKLNSDWLVHALPLRLWLPARTDLPIVGRLLDERWTAYALSWAGAAFDCTVVALLLWRRTRVWAWLAVVGVPRRDVAAVPDRRVPVADDRRDHDLLRARLARTGRDEGASVARSIGCRGRSVR